MELGDMKMRCALGLVAVIVASLGSAAVAADLPRKAPVSYIAPQPVMTWTGFYVGANAGYGWANVGTAGVSNDLKGFIGGGQLGYNWQTGAWVFGVEGDFQGGNESRSDTATLAGISFTVDQKIQWFATARGRIGYAFDAWMLYFTGGAAWQNYKLSVSALGGSIDDNTTKMGWTVGGGLEWMFMPRWSAKLEYLYMDTGDTDVTLFGTTFTGRAKNNIARIGVNYHF